MNLNNIIDSLVEAFDDDYQTFVFKFAHGGKEIKRIRAKSIASARNDFLRRYPRFKAYPDEAIEIRPIKDTDLPMPLHVKQAMMPDPEEQEPWWQKY